MFSLNRQPFWISRVASYSVAIRKPAAARKRAHACAETPYQLLPYDQDLLKGSYEHVSKKIWSRTEEEILVKCVVEQMLGHEVSDLTPFINYYDSEKRPTSRPQNLQFLHKKLGANESKNGRSQAEMDLRNLPYKYDPLWIDWGKVAAALPFRSISTCKLHFRSIVQNAPEEVVQSKITGEIASRPTELTPGFTRHIIHYVTPWSAEDLKRLQLAMIRHSQPRLGAHEAPSKYQAYDWSGISRAVGKTLNECRNKWQELLEIQKIS